MTENLCALAVVAIFVAGAVLGEPIETVLAASMVPVTMGLVHRVVLRARKRGET